MIIDGKKIANSILETLSKEISSLSIQPKLRVILVGNDPASLIYIGAKRRAAEKIGMLFELSTLEETASEEALIDLIQDANTDPSVHGCIIQLPLPRHMNTSHIIDMVDPSKDVDGYGRVNLAKTITNDPTGIFPCTPKGVMRLLQEQNISLSGKNVVVIGYGSVWKPLAAMLSNAGATVTICNSHTLHPEIFTRQADIIVVAVGRPGILTADMVRPSATVIDVGINRTENGLCGDTDFENIAKIADITPVPGGVGPMTVAMLLSNTVEVAKKRSL